MVWLSIRYIEQCYCLEVTNLHLHVPVCSTRDEHWSWNTYIPLWRRSLISKVSPSTQPLYLSTKQSCSSLTSSQRLYLISTSSALFKVYHQFAQFKNYYHIILKTLSWFLKTLPYISNTLYPIWMLSLSKRTRAQYFTCKKHYSFLNRLSLYIKDHILHLKILSKLKNNTQFTFYSKKYYSRLNVTRLALIDWSVRMLSL